MKLIPGMFLVSLLSGLMTLPAWPAERLPGGAQEILPQWREAAQGIGLPETEYVNRLALSDSAYLRQHADNPIDWYAWSADTLALAKQQNKPIFLSIGYASCHWCHVMEKESFSAVSVAEILNAHYISVKVDREQHPDVDLYYSQAVELLQGEAGWPVTALLTPAGKVYVAASYLDQTALKTLLTRSQVHWQTNSALVEQTAGLLEQQLQSRLALSTQVNAATIDNELNDRVVSTLLSEVDDEYGGFGQTAKFPSELKLLYLLERFKVSRDSALGKTLREQLDRIIYSGLSDHVFGGVYRYTTDRAMQKPHFEKMLYNQALVVSLFSQAGRWMDEPAYSRYAERLIDFVEQHMRLADRTMAAAIDADHNGVEGAYYLWTQAQLEKLPAEVNKVAFPDQSFFIYATAPTDGAYLNRLRQQRKDSPRVIDNSITAWNALWLSALIDAGRIEAAKALARHLWDLKWRDNRLYRLGDQQGYLDDYAYLADAYWRLHFMTAELEWKHRAEQLSNVMLQRFYVVDQGLFHQDDASGLPRRTESYHDVVLPNPAIVALGVFKHRQHDLDTRRAIKFIESRALAGISRSPQRFLSLLTQADTEHLVVAKTIAKGHASVVLEPAVQSGQANLWQARFSFEPDWHINAATVTDKQLIPTRISSNTAVQVDYPAGEPLQTEFSDQQLMVYGGDFSIPIRGTQADSLVITLEYQACSNKICLAPETIQLGAAVTEETDNE